MKFKDVINEKKTDYVIYHNSYTSAITAAEEYAKKNGYEIDPEEMFNKVGSGPAKPSKGKTNRINIELTKNGKIQKKALHVQVYNRGTNDNPYELNMYIL